MCGRVMCGVVERRKIVLETGSNPAAGVVQCLLNIGDQFIAQWAEGAVNLSPHP